MGVLVVPEQPGLMAGHEWEDWFEREEFIGQISDMRVQNLQGRKEGAPPPPRTRTILLPWRSKRPAPLQLTRTPLPPWLCTLSITVPGLWGTEEGATSGGFASPSLELLMGSEVKEHVILQRQTVE